MPNSFLKPARRIALIYLAFGSLWILFSDRLVGLFINDAELLSRAQTTKGWFFIGVTSILLYFLLRRTLARVKAVALEDPLTGLPNRQAFSSVLEDRCKRGLGRHQRFDISLLDVDRFQNLNDEHGHAEGDSLILGLARSLRSHLEPDWYLARLGGDEFGLLSPPELTAKEARDRLDWVQHNLTRSSDVPRQASQTISMGTSIFPDDGTGSRDLMRHADMALFTAKTHGRDQHCVYREDIKERLMDRLALTKDLKQACDREAFELVYQPQWSVTRQCWVGAEVLIRWPHPQRGYVSPAEFIPLAEEQGCISLITDFVLKTSFRELDDAGIDRTRMPRLSINLSHRALMDPVLMQNLVNRVRNYGGHRPELLLEITETATMENLHATLDAMKSWRDEGIAFSIDDFGTGYSSLSMLKQLPLKELKIDRSFIQDIPDDRNDAIITQTILAMARTLSLEVVAEGVETDKQAAFLTQHGCTTMQGYYYARPMPLAELKALLQG